jgi:hypothetical protein
VNAGRVLVKVEIERAAGGGSEIVSRFKAKGTVFSRWFGRGWGPLPALHKGDLIVVTFRFRRMSRIARTQSVFAETILNEVGQ